MARAQTPLIGHPADPTDTLRSSPGVLVTQHNEHEAALDLVTDSTHTSAGGLATGKIVAPGTPAVATSTLQGVLDLTFAVDLADAAGASYDITTPDKIQIVDVTVIKTGNGAGNTVQVFTTGDVAISGLMAAAVGGAVTRVSSLDREHTVIAAGAAFRVTTDRLAGSAAMLVLVRALKVA